MDFCDFRRGGRCFAWLDGSRSFLLERLSDGSLQFDTTLYINYCDCFIDSDSLILVVAPVTIAWVATTTLAIQKSTAGLQNYEVAANALFFVFDAFLKKFNNSSHFVRVISCAEYFYYVSNFHTFLLKLVEAEGIEPSSTAA